MVRLRELKTNTNKKAQAKSLGLSTVVLSGFESLRRTDASAYRPTHACLALQGFSVRPLLVVNCTNEIEDIPILRETQAKFGHKKTQAKSLGLSNVVLSGFEPPTHGFSVRCSTN